MFCTFCDNRFLSGDGQLDPSVRLVPWQPAFPGKPLPVPLPSLLVLPFPVFGDSLGMRWLCGNQAAQALTHLSGILTEMGITPFAT